MGIQRIIPEIESRNLTATRDFYHDLLGLQIGMEEGDFLLLQSTANPSAQMIVNDNGYSGLPPGFAIDIDDPDQVSQLFSELQRRGCVIVEPLSDKPWGIRRFSVIDPNGVRVTIASHLG